MTDKRKEALESMPEKNERINHEYYSYWVSEHNETIRKALQQPVPFTCSEEIADVYIDAFNNPDAVIRVVKDCPAPEVVGVEEFNQGFINHPEPTNITMYIKQEYPNGIKIVEDK